MVPGLGAAAPALILLLASAAQELRGTVVRKEDGTPLAAKIFVEDGEGNLHVVPGEPEYRTQEWYAGNAPRFSLVEGPFAIPLAPGKYRLTAMKGFGYRDWEGTIEVRPGAAAEVRIEMERIATLEEEGWYGGDLHIHGKTPLAMLRAEDVNLAAQTIYSSHRPRNLPLLREQSDALHLVCTNQEIEHWNFGNVFYLGLPSTVQDPPGTDPKMTPMFHYDRQAHAAGGMTIRWLRGRPFSPSGNGQQQPEIAVSAALGHMDAWSVLDNSMQETLDRPESRWTGDGWGRSRFYDLTYRTWYRLLNCGLRVSASAGTSYGRLSRLGFNRVYVRCPDGLTVGGFAAALKRGDGFVTNGPLLRLEAEGKLPGEGVALPEAGEVRIAVRLVSRYPVDTVEILRNGRVAAEKKVRDFDGRLEWTEILPVREPSWFAARCFGAHAPRYRHHGPRNAFAHTNPLFVTVAGRKPASAEDAAALLKEVEALIAFAPRIPSDKIRAQALEEYEKARRFYAAQARD